MDGSICRNTSCNNPPAPGCAQCQRCLDRQKGYYRQRRAALIALGKCVKCGKEPPKNGCKYCLVCLGDASEVNALAYPKRAKAARAYAKRKREENIAAGRCRCGRERKPGRNSCRSCLKSRVRLINKQRQNRFADGLCSLCGKQPLLPGQKIGACCHRTGERHTFQPRPLPANHPWRIHDNARVKEIFWLHGQRQAAKGGTDRL